MGGVSMKIKKTFCLLGRLPAIKKKEQASASPTTIPCILSPKLSQQLHPFPSQTLVLV
jgi:hypothetical protein